MTRMALALAPGGQREQLLAVDLARDGEVRDRRPGLADLARDQLADSRLARAPLPHGAQPLPAGGLPRRRAPGRRSARPAPPTASYGDAVLARDAPRARRQAVRPAARGRAGSAAAWLPPRPAAAAGGRGGRGNAGAAAATAAAARARPRSRRARARARAPGRRARSRPRPRGAGRARRRPGSRARRRPCRSRSRRSASPAATASPGCLSQRASVPSSIDTPISGITTSFKSRVLHAVTGPRAASAARACPARSSTSGCSAVPRPGPSGGAMNPSTTAGSSVTRSRYQPR